MVQGWGDVVVVYSEEQQLRSSLTMLPIAGELKAAFSWPPQMVNLGQAVISKDMEWNVSAFLFSHFGFYCLLVDRALGVFAEASSGGSRRMGMPWGWEAWS